MRTTARRWASTGTSSSSQPIATTGRPCTARSLLTLDDVLLEDGKIAPFSRTETNYVAMGRFGNVLLVGGEPDLSLAAQRGEVVRFYLTNTANTRVFKVALPGRPDEARRRRQRPLRARGVRRLGDAGAVRAGRRRRALRRAGTLTLEHQTPDRTYTLATIDVATEPAEPVACRAVRRAPSQPGMGGRAGAAGALLRRATRQDARRSSPRWTWASPKAPSSTPARCTRRSSARSPTAARSAG